MWSSAAYDFPADLPGFTRGAVVELNRKDWAVRAGLFQVPNAPNSDVLVFKTGGAVLEFEERHTIFDQPGKLRLGVFANRGNTGNYRNALAITAADPTLDINDVIVGIQRDNPKYGFYVNAEQQVMKDVGRVRPRQLERRPEPDPVVYRHRPQRIGRPFGQGQLLGTSERYDRHRRRRQRPVRRAPRFPRRRRARPVDRRRPPQLRPRTDFRDLLRLRDRQEFHLHRRLSVHRESRL